MKILDFLHGYFLLMIADGFAQTGFAFVLSDAPRVPRRHSSAHQPRLPARAHDRHYRRHANYSSRRTAANAGIIARTDSRPDLRCVRPRRTGPAPKLAGRMEPAATHRGITGVARTIAGRRSPAHS